jgi:mannose-6-phosphate isomerase-like protein (cupin superfamily)
MELIERPKTGIATKDGTARNNEKIVCASTPVDFKLLGTDTNGDMAVFVSSNNKAGNGPPLHVHQEMDEFFCVLEGEFMFQVGNEKTHLKPGDTIFVPRTVSHAFDCVSSEPGKLIVTIQPASNMEEFFRQLGKLLPRADSHITGMPDIAAINKLYAAHDSLILGPPLR